jgi:hypothetical protein
MGARQHSCRARYSTDSGPRRTGCPCSATVPEPYTRMDLPWAPLGAPRSTLRCADATRDPDRKRGKWSRPRWRWPPRAAAASDPRTSDRSLGSTAWIPVFRTSNATTADARTIGPLAILLASATETAC